MPSPEIHPEPPFGHLRIFVATRAEDVPTAVTRFLSVDGSVPGAELRWDHHVTGERINLDAMPELFDAEGFDGVGTTLADTDAVASVVAVLFGGKARLPSEARQVLEAASHRCDHLSPHPEATGPIDALGRGLNGYVSDALRASAPAEVSSTFEALCREVARDVLRGAPLPYSIATEEAHAAAAARLDAEGRIRDLDGLALVDLRGHGPVSPEATYARHRCSVAVTVDLHRMGGLRYTVGVNPFVDGAPESLRAALEALAAAEYAHGPPARSASPGPGSENWGGRATVFGSPWNYGSRLAPEKVVELVRRALQG